MKKAFTMLELVFVIVIMGIVASIGAEIIVKLYDNYLKTRSINKLQFQTELVLGQIVKRLTYRIKDSVIARQATVANFLNYKTLLDANSSYQILEWIGKDNESFRGQSNGILSAPGWSGFIDLDSNQTGKSLGIYGKLKTPGSELNVTDATIQALSYGTVSLLHGDGKQKPALIFKGQSSFDIDQYGWKGIEGNYTSIVSYSGAGSNDLLNFDENVSAKGVNEIYEQYDLAWSAYAIVPVGNANDFNLTLYYNYQPWENEKYTDGNSSVLVEHVSSFRFRQDGQTIRLKLCIRDDKTGGDYGFCKEKVVF